MTQLSELQSLVQTAVGDPDYTAATITGLLNQAADEAAGRLRLAGLAAESPLVISYKSGACTDGFTGAANIPIYSPSHGYVTGDIVMPSGIVGTTELNSNLYAVTRTDGDNFTLQNTTYNAVEPNYTAWQSAAISAIDLTGTDVKITTSAAHGFTTGNDVFFKQVDGTTELDGNKYTATVIDTTSFTLDNTTPANYTPFAAAAGDNKVYSAATFYKAYIDLPSNFDLHREKCLLRVYSVGQDTHFDYQGGLTQSWATFIQNYPSFDETGNIRLFTVSKGKLYFHPMPTTTDTLILYYTRLPTAMSSATDTPDGFPSWFHRRLVEYAAKEILEERGQLQLAEIRAGKWERSIQELQAFLAPPDTLPTYIDDGGEFYADFD